VQSHKICPTFQRSLLPPSDDRIFYETTRRKIPEGSHFHTRCRRNLKSRLYLCPYPKGTTLQVPAKQATILCMRFEVFTAMKIYTVIFRVVTSCSHVGDCQRSERTPATSTYSEGVRWRQQFPPKRNCLPDYRMSQPGIPQSKAGVQTRDPPVHFMRPLH
jgi:hypothetical protein